MSINPIVSNFSPIEQIIKPNKPEVTPGVEGGKGKGSFSEMLTQSMKEVNDLQHNADKQIADVVMGSDNMSPHNAMIALEKADMAFQMMSAVRSKIIGAYQEIIRTQV